jgi:hypothetical protein
MQNKTLLILVNNDTFALQKNIHKNKFKLKKTIKNYVIRITKTYLRIHCA